MGQLLSSSWQRGRMRKVIRLPHAHVYQITIVVRWGKVCTLLAAFESRMVTPIHKLTPNNTAFVGARNGCMGGKFNGCRRLDRVHTREKRQRIKILPALQGSQKVYHLILIGNIAMAAFENQRVFEVIDVKL